MAKSQPIANASGYGHDVFNSTAHLHTNQVIVANPSATELCSSPYHLPHKFGIIGGLEMAV